MADLMMTFERGGYAALFGVTLTCQIGFPIPAFPVMIGAGVLARSGYFSVLGALGLILVGMGIADALWYEAGRRYGPTSPRVFRRFSRDLEESVRDFGRTLETRGPAILLIQNFIPSMFPLAPALLGVARLGRLEFYVLDLVGSFIFGVLFVGVGYLFGDQFILMIDGIGLAGIIALAAIPMIVIVGRLAWRLHARRRAESSPHRADH